MNLTEMRSDIRTELSDAGTFWSDAEIDRAVEKSVSLLSRFIPKRSIIETTIDRTVKNEALTITSSTGTLAKKPIEVGSLVITGKVLDTDYIVNYLTGVVTEIGSKLPDTDYVANYSLDPLVLDIDTLLPEKSYIKIERVEYPAGDDPPIYLTFEVFGEMLLIKGKDVMLTENKHLRIIYLEPWTAPIVTPDAWVADTVIALNEICRPTTANATGYYYKCTARTGDFKTGASEPTWGAVLGGTTSDDAITWTCIALSDADGDYPEHLDNAVIIGSSGQALILKAEKYVQSSITELELVNAAADSMAIPLADINTALDKVSTHVTEAGSALDKVATYLENNGTDNAKDILANISDDALELRGAVTDALSTSATYLTNESVLPSARKYLTDGDDYITTINNAEGVAEKHAEYAKSSIQLFTGLVAEATVRLDNLRSYIEEAHGWMRIGDGFIAEAAQRLGQAGAYINEALERIGEVNAWAVQANAYTMTSEKYLEIASRYLASGQSKINESFIMLGIKPEAQTYKSSPGQPN